MDLSNYRLGNPPVLKIVISHIPILATTTSGHVSLVKCLAPCQTLLLVLVIVIAASSPPYCQHSRGSHFGGHEHEEVEETL